MATNKNWKQIEEELKLKARAISEIPLERYRSMVYAGCLDMIYEFRPYFQENLHKEAKEELETVDNVKR